MCTFITVAVNKEANMELCKSIAHSYQLAWNEIDNPSVKAQIDSNSHYISTTRKYCDCGTQLAAHYESDEDDRSHFQTLINSSIKKFKKKGWSASKIQRWVTEKEKADERWQKRQKQNSDNLECDSWIKFINELFEQQACSTFSLLVHEYQKGLSNERIHLSKTKKMKLPTLTGQDLSYMNKDELLTIHH